MAFWGIEVKPGKPITHSCEKARGRLRISQATLGIGEAAKKTIVQCNVGKRAPVLLCALLPNQTESCHLDLEFEEADDVIFSVIGPRSVYLTGYYVRQSLQLNPHSDTESYGVDIENTQTEGSSYSSDEDNYDDSFINDDELQVCPQSPVLSDKGIDEVTPENDKPKGKIGPGKQRRKKFQVIESDNEDDHSLESEDDDAYTLSAFKSKRAVKRAPSDSEKVADVTAEVDNEVSDEGVCDEPKKKLGSCVSNAEEKVAEATADMGGEAKDKDVCDESKKSIDPLDINDKLGSEKPKKKRKEHSTREEKTCGFQADDCNALVEDKEQEVEASMDMETDANCAVMLLELGSVSDHKEKKRKTELPLEGPQTDGIDNNHYAIPKDDALGPLPHSNRNTKDLLVADGEYQEKHMVGNSTEGIDIKCDSILEKEEVNLGLQHGDCMTTDPPVHSEGFQEQHIDNVNPELVANDSRPGKKSKKKKKGQDKRDLNTGLPETTIAVEATPVKGGDENTIPVPIESTTLSTGLVIEVLENGPPDGKVAAPGKKVKIYYTGMLRENGFVFDSNVGKSPFKFCLGDEAYIDGWNDGIDGMRVGDKRRLTIPPSMGFGDIAVKELVPPNSWLVYDIELVGIRK